MLEVCGFRACTEARRGYRRGVCSEAPLNPGRNTLARRSRKIERSMSVAQGIMSQRNRRTVRARVARRRQTVA